MTTRTTDTQDALHVLNRVAFGPRPGDLAAVRQIGVDRYITQQLSPDSIPEPGDLMRRIDGLHTLRMTPVELFLEFQQPLRQAAKGDQDARMAARRQARQVIMEAVEARIARAIYGTRQLHEVMTNFWFNHFNVFAGKGLCSIWSGAFEQEAIRPNALGRFRDLLGATAKHPAMLFYLDNWRNTAPNAPGARGKFNGINENYARELMELHTLGVNGGYTQNDVIALAHILTGWGLIKPGGQNGEPRSRGNIFAENPSDETFRPRRQRFFAFRRGRQRPPQDTQRSRGVTGENGFFFDASRHDFAVQTILEHLIPAGGIEQGEHALDLLARSPTTANHLSAQLAQYFVADDPPPALVRQMANRYLTSGGDISVVLATLFSSGEFWDRRNYNSKFKTPYEYVISSVRATGAPVVNVLPLAGTMARLGMPLYGCQTPDGYKNTRPAWLNPDAMMLRLSFATALGAGRLPLERRPDADLGALGGFRKGGPEREVKFDGTMSPPDPAQLATTLGGQFSPRTAEAVESAPAPLRAPLIL
ncbi:MAG TPA: DUF1800 domain-containing protein, partial [Candidatus Binataceae bacterium]|nr:DUF1800 domain-containing protein [Candidatus Binataceae bacterium]